MERPALPLDIVIMILENLRVDTATLKTCAVVCREWAEVVRPLLFRSLYLTIRTAQGRGAKFIALVLRKGSRLHDFKCFLDSTPTVCGTITELTLRRDPQTVGPILFNGCLKLPLPNLDFEVLLKALSKTVALQRIIFLDMFCEEISPSLDAKIVCTSVRVIVMKSVIYASTDPDHLSKVVSHLPNVTDVQVIRCTNAFPAITTSMVQSNPSPSEARLRSLTITYVWPMVYWCNFHTHSLESLQSLSVTAFGPARDPTDIVALKRTFLAAGKQLLYASLSLGNPPDDSGVFDPGDLLAPCRILRTFSFDISPVSHTLPALQLLANLLAHCKSPDLRHILVPMPIVPDPDYWRQYGAAWNAIQLACEQHRLLRSVVFQHNPARAETELLDRHETVIRALLPGLDERDLLRFRREDWRVEPRYKPM